MNVFQLRQGQCLLKEGEGLFSSFKAAISPRERLKHFQSIETVVKKTLLEGSQEEKAEALKLGNLLVRRYSSSWGATRLACQSFDRCLAPLRATKKFLENGNQHLFEKWTSYGFSSEIFLKYPEFATYLQTQGLLSQMKVCQDVASAFSEKEGEDGTQPTLKVEGKELVFSAFKKRFSVQFSEKHKERMLIENSSGEVYTYLDHGTGFEKFNPYHDLLKPISTISPSDLLLVQQSAQLFVRQADLPGIKKPKRSFTAQIVSSYVNGYKTHATGLLAARKHPYLRLIDDRGKVIDIGFGCRQQPMLPLQTTTGVLRAIDLYEYLPFDKKFVTNIAITKEEFEKIQTFIKFHFNHQNVLGRKIGFNFLRQNCSVFVKKAFDQIGIETPTEIHLIPLVQRIAPDWLKSCYRRTTLGGKKIKAAALLIGRKLPHPLKKGITFLATQIAYFTRRFFEAVFAIASTPFRFLLGSPFGASRTAFSTPSENPEAIAPLFWNLESLFSLKKYVANLPGILQEWQEKQASTLIFEKPIKLTVVPKF